MLTRIRYRLRPLFILWIVIMWCLLMGELTWANVIGGLAVGLVVVIGLPLPAMPTEGITVHWGKLVVFLGRWLVGLVRASVKVAWLALRPQEQPRTAIVQAPMRVSNELVLYFATVFYNLQPGGAVTDVDLANRTWTLHLLDVDNEESLQRELAAIRRLEQDMLRVFERV